MENGQENDDNQYFAINYVNTYFKSLFEVHNVKWNADRW